MDDLLAERRHYLHYYLGADDVLVLYEDVGRHAAQGRSQRGGSFVPQCVEQYEDKAYIKGYIDTNGWEKPYRELPYDDGFLPAEIICDVENGSVTHALLYCEILDKQE